VDWNAHLDRDGVDSRHAYPGIDEQPLPIERHDLDLDGLSGQGLEGIELVRTEPRDAAQHHDHQRGDRPDDQLEMARELPFRPIEGACIGSAEPEGEAGDQEHDRQDDRQHDRQRIDQDEQLGGADRPCRIEHAAAAGERRGHERRREDTARLRRPALQTVRIRALEKPSTHSDRSRGRRPQPRMGLILIRRGLAAANAEMRRRGSDLMRSM
jgi:hypothetical protein